ncbi:GH92 family glycosyl hydrolase [Jatrophihabitans sp. YIM 134969]
MPPFHLPPARRRTAALALVPTSVVAVVAATLAAAGPAGAAPVYVADPANLVNPIIGTSGAVDDFPGADVPFGMVQFSPDTPSRPAGGGYEYDDDAVTGFSLTHISGPGCPAAGDVPLLPVAGAVPANPDAATLPLDHTKEQATAGRYQLTGGGVTTALTTTTRSGMARISYPAGQQQNLLLKLSDSAAGTDATHVQFVSSTEITGSVTSGHFCGASDVYTLFFDITFDRAMSASGTWQGGANVAAGKREQDVTGRFTPSTATRTEQSDGTATPRVHPTAGASVSKAAQPPVTGASGAYASFAASTTPLQAKVGISYVSAAGAKGNRTAENPGWNFDSVATAAHKAWKAQLAKIQVGGGKQVDQQIFYTALYHALLHPNVVSDSNGRYAGFDGQTHTAAAGHVEYGNYSGWDIYRSQVQLAAMVAPQQTSDSIRSMLDQYDQTGQLPKWALNNGESYVMVGDPADPIIADAYAFGARDFDTAKALKAMVREAQVANNVRPALAQYLSKGYIPNDGQYGCCNFYGAVSTQQEYNTADHAISTFAAALGNGSTASTFAARANNWQNVFNPASGYLQPKLANGQFVPGFVPGTSNGFVEGNSYQYTPMEPFDVKGLALADGGNAAWIAKLDGLTTKLHNGDSSNADFGNEPSIEIPWEYDYVGAPYRTQKVVRDIQQQIFPAAPAGIAGNDDLGTMSAWYVFSALGFYPETPGTADLALGSPVFPAALVHLPSGGSLTITGDGAATDAPYVQSATLNGSSWTHAYLKPSVVSQGGALAFQLGTTPNTTWAGKASDAPPSDTAGLLPALGYTTESSAITTPGGDVDVTVGARSLSGTQQVTWTAHPASGVGGGVTNGTIQSTPKHDGTQQIGFTAPQDEGRYLVTISFQTADGTDLPDVVVEIDVAKPGELWPFYNNAGIASDGASGQADFDGDGWAYSQQALAAAGVHPGDTVSAQGVDFTWPATAPGDLDNIEAGGQTIPLVAVAGATKVGILGSASNADPGAQGQATVTYTDGSTSTVTLGLSDWTLGAGAHDPSYGNGIVAQTPYRDTTNGDKQTVDTFVFAATADLTAGKTVSSVTLPDTVSSGQFHVFAVAVK